MPRTNVGIYGKVGHQFVVGSLEIERKRLRDPRNRRPADHCGSQRCRVEVTDLTRLNPAELQGLHIDGSCSGNSTTNSISG